MDWKHAIRAGNSEMLSTNVIDVVEKQDAVDYPNRVEGILTVALYANVPDQASDTFIDDVLIASISETGYDEFESFRWFDASDPEDATPWAADETNQKCNLDDHAVQVAKQQGVVPYHTAVRGTVRALVGVDVPMNWGETELKFTCIGRLLRDGPDTVIDVEWTEVPASQPPV